MRTILARLSQERNGFSFNVDRQPSCTRIGTTDAPRLCTSRIREKFALVSCKGFPRNVMENFWIVGGRIYMIYYNGYTDFRT